MNLNMDFWKSCIKNLNNLPPVKLGFIYAILIISITKLIYLIINYTYLILILYSLLRLFLSVFCIFSLFTWLNLVLCGTHYLTDTRTFVLLLTCFASEFFIQFMVFNTNLFSNINNFNDLIKYFNSTSNSQFFTETNDVYIYRDELEIINNSKFINNNQYRSTITSLNSFFYYLVDNFHNALLIAVTCTLTNCFYTKRLNMRENFAIVLLIFLTRFYGIVNFSQLIPHTICAYFTYFCAFSGVLFSKYLENFIQILSNNNNNLNKNDKNHDCFAVNQISFESFLKNMTSDDHGKIFNQQKSGLNLSKSNINTSKPKRKQLNAINLTSYKRRTSLPMISSKSEKDYLELNMLISLKKDIQSIIEDVFKTDQINVSDLINGYKSIQARLNLVSLLNYSSNKFKNGCVSHKFNFKNNEPRLNERIEPNQIEHNNDGYNGFNSYSADEDEEVKVDLNESNVFNQISSKPKSRNRNSLNNTINVPVQFLTSSYNKHRNSQILTWSTTTSANGYPNIELLQSSKQRSLSLRSNLQINNHSLINFNSVDNKLNQKYVNIINNSSNNKNNENELSFREFSKNFNKILNQSETKKISKNKDVNIDARLNANKDDDNKNGHINGLTDTIYDDKNFNNSDNITNITNNKINILKAAKTSDYDSCESPNSSDYNSDTDKLLLKETMSKNIQKIDETTSNNLSNLNINNNVRLEEIEEEVTHINNQNKRYLINNTCNYQEDDDEKDNRDEKLPWQPEDLNNLDYLNYLHDWNFPIFKFTQESPNYVLSQMAYKIFHEVGLFKTFEIPVNQFILYFTELEKGYFDLPYHNKIHAADVLHACYYFSTQAIPGLKQIKAISPHKERLPLNPHQYSLKYSLINDDIYSCLGANFTPLELLALFCSAAMHDYDHPGRNNQFLVSISSPLALMYNDRSVLENHHASSSWKLLKSNPGFNFLSNLDAAEWKRFRFLVLENILATDLSKHFSIISDFNTRYKNGCGIDWSNEADRLLVANMIIKISDINAPLKDKELHVQWTERIVEEFYLQGEEERNLGIPISPFMDRTKPQVAKLQESFIKGLVGSLCNAYTGAGLLPGVLIEDSKEEDDDEIDKDLIEIDSDESQTNSSKLLSTSEKMSKKNGKGSTKIFYSDLTNNLKKNYDMWCEILKQQNQN